MSRSMRAWRGMDVFAIQSICSPVNNNLSGTSYYVDALKRASAERITAVLPYYGMLDSDRKVSPRAPITAQLVADLITSGRNVPGSDHRPFMQVRSKDSSTSRWIICSAAPRYSLEYLKNLKNDTVMVSPDAGGVERTRALLSVLGPLLAIIDKRRDAPNVSEVMNIIGDIKGKWRSFRTIWSTRVKS